MKTNLKRDARLLALVAVLAALPLAIWACGDAGDGPGGATGPGSVYNPNMNYQGATITTRVDRTTVGTGETFGILATFLDANGRPVEGVPLFATAESGGAAGYFTIETNPTITDANGKASINVYVTSRCPNGSYSFVIATQRAWSARGYAKVVVEGGTGGSVTAVSISGNATPTVGVGATYQATVTATCDYELEFQFTDTPGAWYPASDVLYTYAWTAAGSYSAYAHARCAGSTSGWTLSNALAVTVAAAP